MIFNRYTTYRPGLFARLLPSGRWKLRLPTATTASVELHTGTRAELRCLDITAVGIKKALLWHTVEIRTRSHVETLSCLGEEAATRLATDLHRFINRYLLELIESDQEALKEVDAKIGPLIEGMVITFEPVFAQSVETRKARTDAEWPCSHRKSGGCWIVVCQTGRHELA